MKVFELLNTKNILTEFKTENKEDVINELVDLLKGDQRVLDLEDVRKCVFEREEKMSTGVGKGFAIHTVKQIQLKIFLLRLEKVNHRLNIIHWMMNQYILYFCLSVKKIYLQNISNSSAEYPE